jgi:hypothetical protein
LGRAAATVRHMAHADRWIDASDLEDDEPFESGTEEDDYDEIGGGDVEDDEFADYDET